MGYTHYWYRPAEIGKEQFQSIVQDFKKVLSEMEEAGIDLAGWDGSGEPEINNNTIAFNGMENCGHESRELGITWPSEEAGGVEPGSDAVKGSWFAGALLDKRACGGDCSHETFRLDREPDTEYKILNECGRYFDCTKTAYKPYDLAVTAALIIAKYHLGDRIEVSSDGGDQHWFDARLLCQSELGYGLELDIFEELPPQKV